MYPIRGAVTWKSTVGTNVASDALANLASGGVTGGALVIVGEDYGEGSSIMQERSHAFAMKSQIWLLDPRPNLESMVKAVEDGFSLSEASKTPVMLLRRAATCTAASSPGKQAPRLQPGAGAGKPGARHQPHRAAAPSFLHEQEKIKDRWPAAIRYIKEHKLNEHFDGDQSDIGLILQGGLYNGVIRALQLLGLADHFGNSRIPLYVMNVTYPVIEDEVIDSAATSAPCCCSRKASPTTSSRARGCARPASPRSSGTERCPWPASTPPRSCARACANSCAATAPNRCRRIRPWPPTQPPPAPPSQIVEIARAARQTRRAAHHLPQACRGR